MSERYSEKEIRSGIPTVYAWKRTHEKIDNIILRAKKIVGMPAYRAQNGAHLDKRAGLALKLAQELLAGYSHSAITSLQDELKVFSTEQLLKLLLPENIEKLKS